MRNDPDLARKENFYIPQETDIVSIVGGPKEGLTGVVKTIDRNGTSEFWSLGIEIAGIKGLVATPARNVQIKIKGNGKSESTNPETPFEQRTPEQLSQVLEYRSHQTEEHGFSQLAIEKIQLDLRDAGNVKLMMIALSHILMTTSPGNRVSQMISYELQKRSEIVTE